MGTAKVWNDNDLDFVQDYKGDRIVVPAKGYIEMEHDEAVSFKSYPSHMRFDGMGQQTKDSYKMLRVEWDGMSDNKVIMFRSHKDGSIHASREALTKYETEFDESAFADAEGAAAAKRAKKG